MKSTAQIADELLLGSAAIEKVSDSVVGSNMVQLAILLEGGQWVEMRVIRRTEAEIKETFGQAG